MKVAIVGSRSFTDYKVFSDFMEDLTENEHLAIEEIISGGAKGADSLAEIYAKDKGIPIEIIRPDWNAFGKSAGFIRNRDIIMRCDVCVAFWDGYSHGTKHDIDLCKEFGKQCYVKNTEENKQITTFDHNGLF